MLVSDFDFHLPEELIAQEPLPERSQSRMLHLWRESGRYEDRKFADFPDLLRPDDLLVVNNSRVFPARLFGRRAGAHAQPVSPRNPAAKEFLQGRVEVLLTRQVGPFEWQALVRPGRKIDVGEKIYFGGTAAPAASSPAAGEGAELAAEITARGEFGERTLRFGPVADFFAVVEKLGHVPLPPYIHRPDQAPDQPADRERYQTVYAGRAETGSVAAPTAGLHFTPEILARIRNRGVEIAEITLHVGLGTFQPVHVERVEDHKMHGESFHISEAVAAQINRALEEKRRVVAVGTTTVRALEFAALQQQTAAERSPAANVRGGPATSSAESKAPVRIAPGSGEAGIFIYPGFQFRVVGAMLTNFHLPKSTLLMLVSAFAGKENILRAYEHAVRERYRFFSYGDCMFVE
ncbi:MAG: tRNA preQ1(34) S-adenosylmethionine ribosyltransferase-isomerase QueA [Acidobacteriia bacterium]|nr:tRNA preQ1(34) S-adenosylmethionine ribosyltransferase-isomerase QueA [Terriglobia bacterium]